MLGFPPWGRRGCRPDGSVHHNLGRGRSFGSPRLTPARRAHRLIRILALTAAGLMLAACATTSEDTRSATVWMPNVLEDLTNSDWILDTSASTPAITASTPITIRFTTDHTVSGTTPCNSYHGGFKLDGETIKIGPLAQTLRACEPPGLAAEQSYLSALQAVQEAQNSPQDRLELTGGTETHLVFDARPVT